MTTLIGVLTVASMALVLGERWLTSARSTPQIGSPPVRYGHCDTPDHEFDDLEPHHRPPTYLNVRLHTADEDDVLGQIYQAVDDFLARHPRVPEPARTHVAIAVAEIGANIIEHAGRGRHIRVQMTLQLFTDEIRVDFTDNGRSGDIDLTAVQMPDPMQDRGRGLAVARSVLRRLYYHADDTGNRWTLISNRFSCD